MAITAKSYTLHTDNGAWLGQVILTSDGMFSSVTDYGNFSFAWRSFGDGLFEDFILKLNVDYFGNKMYSGMSYIAHSQKIDNACHRFAKEILPALQAEITEQREKEASAANVNAKTNPLVLEKNSMFTIRLNGGNQTGSPQDSYILANTPTAEEPVMTFHSVKNTSDLALKIELIPFIKL